jgi:hypothetical protein
MSRLANPGVTGNTGGRAMEPPPTWWTEQQIAAGQSPTQQDASWRTLSPQQRLRARIRVSAPTGVHWRKGRVDIAPPWYSGTAETWEALGVSGRSNAKSHHADHLRRRDIVQRQIDDGTTISPFRDTWYRNDGFVQHDSSQAREHFYDSKKAAERYAWRLEHAKGCSVPDCPYAPPSIAEKTAGRMNLLCHLQHDHLQPNEKVKGVTHLCGVRRDAELEKTDVKCLAHHQMRTNQQQGSRKITDLAGAVRTLAEEKVRRGCERRFCTSKLNGLFAMFESVGTLHTFLHVSHLHRSTKKKLTIAQKLKDLLDKKAICECAMCHAVKTLMERAEMFTTPDTVQQVAMVPQEWRDEFRAETVGVDWKELKVHFSTCMKKIANSRDAKVVAIDGVVDADDALMDAGDELVEAMQVAEDEEKGSNPMEE